MRVLGVQMDAELHADCNYDETLSESKKPFPTKFEAQTSVRRLVRRHVPFNAIRHFVSNSTGNNGCKFGRT